MLMTRTSRPKYVPGYDLFKLIVAVVLTIILIALLLRNRQQPPAAPITTETPWHATITTRPSSTPKPPTQTALPATVTATVELATLTVQPSSTVIPLSQTETAELATLTAISPTTTPQLSASTPTALPAPVEPIPTSDPNACPSAASRIRIGDNLQVLVRLNLRTGPSLNWPIIRTNEPGTSMQVIGGPVCTRRGGPGSPKAYLWWNVRMQNGQEGWSAEAPLISPYYFLAPIR